VGWLASLTEALSRASGLHPNAVAVILVIYMGLAVASVVSRWLMWDRPDREESELVLRVRSWWVMVTLVVGALSLGRGPAIVFFAFVSFLALKEYLSIIPTRRADREVLLIAYLAIPVEAWFIATAQYGLFTIFVPVYMFMAIPAAMVVLGHTDGFLKAVGTLHWGLMIAVYALGHIAYLLVLPEGSMGVLRGPHSFGEGASLVLLLLVLTELNDVAQYVWGKSIGRRKIVPKISPGKTWGGFLGGLATTALVAVPLVPFLMPDQPPAQTLAYALGLGLVVAFVGFFGDVSVSGLKRDLGIKDSGTLIPGHGGILDRVNSLIFTAPLFLHYTRYFNAPYW
jgi:phosphatidate cytidylyltransferase